uniref:B30.2/SPRY domain-containing protein n=1 Tax=Oncorhynchus tshawytscha TaxID=74940 RepID=A0A8C8CIJ3_ONCTS
MTFLQLVFNLHSNTLHELSTTRAERFKELLNGFTFGLCLDLALCNNLLSEENFLCSICLDVFSEPVTTTSAWPASESTGTVMTCASVQSVRRNSTGDLRFDWSEISVPPQSEMRRAVSQLHETIRSEIKKLCGAELKWMQQWSVDVTLDPDTAHPSLILSNDRKQVRYGIREQNLPDKPKRFSKGASVLGKDGFSGRLYYEVQVKEKTKCDLGVNGYRTIWLRNTNFYAANDDPAVNFLLREKPQKVGVFGDYEEGQVSFYDVEARCHIYSVTGCTFTEKIYPYFCPCLNVGKNSAPLIITPVNHTD